MTRARKTFAIVGGIVVAFLVGFGWQFVRAHGLQGQLDQAQKELTFQRMEATLGAATIEAQRGGFEPARQLASDFFTRLQGAIETVPDNEKSPLREILQQRDAVITELSRSDGQSGAVLASLFVRYRAAVGEAPVTPAATPVAPATAPATPAAP